MSDEASSVFEAFERTYDGPASETESIFDWLDRAGTADAVAARAYVEGRYSQFRDDTGQLRSSLRATSAPNANNDFFGALGSLYVFDTLGCPENSRVDEQVVGNERRPDLQVLQDSGSVDHTVEVTAVCPNPEWAASDWRISELVDAINGALESDEYSLALWPEGVWSEPPPADQVIEQIAEHMALLPGSAAVADAYHESGYLPGFDFAYPSCAGRIEFIPLDPEKVAADSEDDDRRIVGSIMMTGGSTNTVARLRNKIRSKHPGRYPADLECSTRPYVLTIVNVDHFCDVQDIVDALFGESVVVYHGGPDDYTQTRSPDGVFTPNVDGTIRNRAISAVLFVDGLKSEMFGLAQPRRYLVANPYALNPAESSEFQPDYALLPASEGRMEWTPELPDQDG